jgi:hypothetical protein
VGDGRQHMVHQDLKDSEENYTDWELVFSRNPHAQKHEICESYQFWLGHLRTAVGSRIMSLFVADYPLWDTLRYIGPLPRRLTQLCRLI